MQAISRKTFLQQSGILTAAAVAGNSFSFKKHVPLLAFSTLGCPDWNFNQIVDFAAAHGYQGIEVRCIQRELNLPRTAPFNSAEAIAATMSLMKSKGLRFCDLGSSATMHITDPAKRKETMEEGKRFIDLAQQLNCPFIRVYPNNFTKDQDKKQVIELIAHGLQEMGDYAKDKHVMVLMETHGDAVYMEDLLNVMQLANHSTTGLIWDISNMWTITKEPPAEVYKTLKKWIKHTHIKDAKLVDGKPQYVFLGKGEVPIFEAIDILEQDGYKGFYSFEWEKMWHPELAEPELALADFPEAMRKHFA